MATVSIPLLLKDVTGGVRRAEVQGATIAEVIAALEGLFPGIEARIRDGQRIRPIFAFTVDGVIATQGLATPVGPASAVDILPVMGGG